MNYRFYSPVFKLPKLLYIKSLKHWWVFESYLIHNGILYKNKILMNLVSFDKEAMHELHHINLGSIIIKNDHLSIAYLHCLLDRLTNILHLFTLT